MSVRPVIMRPSRRPRQVRPDETHAVRGAALSGPVRRPQGHAAVTDNPRQAPAGPETRVRRPPRLAVVRRAAPGKQIRAETTRAAVIEQPPVLPVEIRVAPCELHVFPSGKPGAVEPGLPVVLPLAG